MYYLRKTFENYKSGAMNSPLKHVSYTWCVVLELWRLGDCSEGKEVSSERETRWYGVRMEELETSIYNERIWGVCGTIGTCVTRVMRAHAHNHQFFVFSTYELCFWQSLYPSLSLDEHYNFPLDCFGWFWLYF